jgi:ADP-heptose:LPS heptosyltransferase
MRDLHTVDYNLALLEPLGVRDASIGPQLNLPKTAFENADALRRSSKITRPYLILHPGSARREKLWEPQRWAQLVEHFGQNNDFDLVFTSGRSRDEQAHVAAITKLTSKQIIDLSTKTDLLTLAALIAQAQLLVTVDSAPVHLAAVTHTPQVILFGPTNPFHWRPMGSPALILQGKSGAPLTEFAPVCSRFPMSEISTEAVIGAMDSVLPRRAAAHSS